MCHQQKVLHLVCKHTTTYVSHCKGKSFLRFFGISCKLTRKPTSQIYDLCSSCIEFWDGQLVSESDATKLYRIYRQRWDYWYSLMGYEHEGQVYLVPDLPWREESGSAARRTRRDAIDSHIEYQKHRQRTTELITIGIDPQLLWI